MTLIRPAMIVLFNYIFIPTLVDWFSYLIGFEKKSTRHKSNLMKQFIIIVIASIFIPITGMDTIESFIKYMTEQDIHKFHLEMSNNFLRSSDYFLRYLI